MKILKFKIKDKLGEIIRDIEFARVGISFIYGDIQDPKNLGATINSLGKTLLIKCIDYIYGANEDSKIIKEDIHGYILEAVIEYENKEYIIKRILGTSEEILINDKPYGLTEYKEFFNIKRSVYGKQIIVNKKVSEISYRANPNKDDYVNFLNLLGLNDIIKSIEEIYNSQDTIKSYKKNKLELINFYGDFDLSQIDEEIYFVDKEVKRLTDQLDVISKKIKTIEISEMQNNIVEEYANKSAKLKKTKSEYENAKLECSRLIEFIANSNKVDISSEHILAIYEKTKQEVPELVKRKIQEVEAFHKKVFDERKEFLNSKKGTIEKHIGKLEVEIANLSTEIDKLGKIISLNQVYQESIELYEKYNSDLQELKYKEGKLSQVKNIDDNINTEDSNLTINFDDASKDLAKYKELIEEYRDFIYNITKSIYDEDVNSYFDINIKKKHQKTRPVSLEINLKGDTGEGVNEVKKNLMDYLLFRYNNYMEILIQDSSCYNGIDPRQVSNMLTEVSNIAKTTNKQAIIAINKYQLGEYEDVIELVKANSSIILSEKDKLFGFDF